MKRWMAMALAASSLVGCGTDYSVDFKYLTDADAAVVLTRDRIEIPVGYAVGAEAYPVEDNERKGYIMELSPTRPNVIGIDRGLEENQWVLYGISEGTTEVDMIFEDEFVGSMPAIVVAPRE